MLHNRVSILEKRLIETEQLLDLIALYITRSDNNLNEIIEILRTKKKLKVVKRQRP